jgi:hypothetical protein
LEKAAEFDELARSTNDPSLQKQYEEVADSFRLMASVRLRLYEMSACEPGR